MADSSEEPAGGDVRARILAAAAALVAEGGGEAATTRAVAAAAGVQAPTIYRLFGDKRGLLDAVAEATFAAYVAGKAGRGPGADPVDDLRAGWDAHIAFGLAHPEIFLLISTPQQGASSPAADAGKAVLREKIRRVARAGRLRVSEDRALDLVCAMGTGALITLLAKAPQERADLSQAARETVLAEILATPPERPDGGIAAHAVALRACLDEMPELTPGERLLMDELLQRLSRAAAGPDAPR